MKFLKNNKKLIISIASSTLIIVACLLSTLLILLHGISWEVHDPNFGIVKDHGDMLSHIKTNFENFGGDGIHPWKEIILWFIVAGVSICSILFSLTIFIKKDKWQYINKFINASLMFILFILVNVLLGLMVNDKSYCFVGYLNPKQAFPDEAMAITNFVLIDLFTIAALGMSIWVSVEAVINKK